MKGIMIQGTASSVGKSLIAVAFCRLLYESGYQVAPFKAQNVTQNFHINSQGEKIAKSQAIQAKAAKTKASTFMNPTSLTLGEQKSKVILLGKEAGIFKRTKNHKYVYEKWIKTIQTSLDQLHKQYDSLVIEGAGSPVELNLKDQDVANMKTAELADVPVILVADINKGGAFASIVGTLELLTPEERKRVKGIIINKFQGKKSLFQNGIRLMEQKTNLPVLGVLPYIDHDIEEEDNMDLLDKNCNATTSSLPTDDQIESLAQKMKQHLNWEQIIEIIEQWDMR
ncbi:MAG TPA: cobyric acid synthase [Candidatus Avamphibacillus sp.]|nr:cobyric acid synthase [Candidatus Avamphibacillus sp.]